MSIDFRSQAIERPRGHWYEDFEVGTEFVHHWGRTINQSDNSLFSTLTLHFNPLYYNVEFAREHGHPCEQVNPMLVFTTVFGLSVEDLSENGGAFLGVEDLSFRRPVYPGDTVTARSSVHARRLSEKNPKQGICTWHTRGFNQRGEEVIDFKRTNLVSLKPAGASA
ncbi:MaoC family dehydratase [Chelatococcus reniformis]|uniref:MaoC family dehydratase n=1 Tax=Chelatococcus reniformis TaxID=1494448 RepID=A0A916XFM4_9HYPH|nr:MaoC family dehydratase [Chelatococcus reniformis]GGC69963.1 MaoC family dehydratase [Chelatococcus reniformis]